MCSRSNRIVWKRNAHQSCHCFLSRVRNSSHWGAAPGDPAVRWGHPIRCLAPPQRGVRRSREAATDTMVGGNLGEIWGGGGGFFPADPNIGVKNKKRETPNGPSRWGGGNRRPCRAVDITPLGFFEIKNIMYTPVYGTARHVRFFCLKSILRPHKRHPPYPPPRPFFRSSSSREAHGSGSSLQSLSGDHQIGSSWGNGEYMWSWPGRGRRGCVGTRTRRRSMSGPRGLSVPPNKTLSPSQKNPTLKHLIIPKTSLNRHSDSYNHSYSCYLVF